MASEKLEIRKQIKKRKPTFKRAQTNQFAKLRGDGWRKPKGMGNKLRRGRKGHAKKPTIGFGSPKEVRGLNKNGLLEVIVNNVSDLANVKDSKTQIATLGSKVGAKKRLAILNAAKTSKLAVSNVKDIDEAIKKYTKTSKVEKKVEKKVAAPKKADTTAKPKTESESDKGVDKK